MLFSSCPVLYWYCASVLLNKQDNVFERPHLREAKTKASSMLHQLIAMFCLVNPLSYPPWSSQRVLLYYFYSYIVIGCLMHSNFLPWTWIAQPINNLADLNHNSVLFKFAILVRFPLDRILSSYYTVETIAVLSSTKSASPNRNLHPILFYLSFEEMSLNSTGNRGKLQSSWVTTKAIFRILCFIVMQMTVKFSWQNKGSYDVTYDQCGRTCCSFSLHLIIAVEFKQTYNADGIAKTSDGVDAHTMPLKSLISNSDNLKVVNSL